MGGNKLSNERKLELREQVFPLIDEFIANFSIQAPIIDTVNLLEKLGYLFVKFPAPDKLSGFHIKKSNYNCIFINSSHSVGRQNFSAWHEVYHAYSGEYAGLSYSGEAKYSEVEYKADTFASSILIPADQVEKYLKRINISDLKYISNVELIRMQNYFQVSYSALLTRLCFLYPNYADVFNSRRGLGSLNKRDEMRKKIIDAGMTFKLVEASNDFYVSDTLYKLLYENLEADRISMNKANSILEMIEGVKNRYSKKHT